MSDFKNFKIDWIDIYEKLDTSYHSIVGNEFGNSDITELLKSTSSNNILFWPDGTEKFKRQLPGNASKYDKFFLETSEKLTSILRDMLLNQGLSKEDSMKFIITGLPATNFKANGIGCDEFARCENGGARVSAADCCRVWI